MLSSSCGKKRRILYVITATLTASDESVLGQVTLEDVTLNKNITTAYSGGILGTAKSFTLTADDAWGDDDVHTW